MKRRLPALIGLLACLLAFGVSASGASAAEGECEPRSKCFAIESAEAELSTTQAGAHPDLTVSFALTQDPNTEPNVFGLHQTYESARDISIELPPGLVGDPNILGVSQQCGVSELLSWGLASGGGCPNGSQVGIVHIALYGLLIEFTEPIYMMEPPDGSDTVARLGFIAGIYPTFVDFSVRSDGDYGLTANISDASSNGEFVIAKTTTWGVPAAPEHDTERMTAKEAFTGASNSPPRPPGSVSLAFMTNPTSCGAGKQVIFKADNWVEPNRVVSKTAELPAITGCDKLPFNPSVTVKPTTQHAASPTGLDITFGLPAPDGVEVLESSQLKDIRIDLPPGMVTNPGSADGLGTCSAAEVGFGRNESAHCPDSAKLASTEFNVPSLPRPLKGAIYLREPEPGHLLRIWVVADDLGAHVKLPGEITLDESTGQLESVVLNSPQVPLREVKLLFKSGFRAPLITPTTCGTYQTHWSFTPWSGTGAVSGDAPMTISQGCDTGGFSPDLSAGTTSPAAGRHSAFVFKLTTEDGEQNPRSLDVTLPEGLSATLAGVARCEGFDAATGNCPAASRIGRVIAADGYGPAPLWVPQAGKRPTAVYLGGPYEGARLSIVAVVPAQAGPFDLGDQVVRSAIQIDPLTAQVSVSSDPLPQIIQGIPVAYRTIDVILDRPDFTLNPTSCEEMSVDSAVASNSGALAHPSSRFQASGCRGLAFKPRLSLKLKGGTGRGAHPRLRAVARPRSGDADMASLVTRLPHSAFLDQAHIRTICTRVQYAAGAGHGSQCPKGSIYGHVRAFTPILDEPLEGPVFLRSSNHNLPDMVLSLHGLVDIEAVGRIDSVNGGIRSSFEAIPDAPLSKVVLTMQGGKKGLIVNSTNICKGRHRANAAYTAHNGRRAHGKPLVRASCAKGHKKKHRRHRRHRSG